MLPQLTSYFNLLSRTCELNPRRVLYPLAFFFTTLPGQLPHPPPNPSAPSASASSYPLFFRTPTKAFESLISLRYMITVKSAIPNPKFQILNSKSPFPNPYSPLPILHSLLKKGKTPRSQRLCGESLYPPRTSTACSQKQ